MFKPGQRWISTAEPELGLGTVLRVEGRGVQMLFTKAGVLRPYAQDSAPLVRAEFRVGQRVAGKGIAFVVERIEEEDGLLVYRGEGRQLHEGQLDDEQSISQADERLTGGRVDPVAQFELRLDALKRRAAARRSPAWGLKSARIDLIPHQLRVAGMAASRPAPRVLLADEVGLGKTIEAGMIVARQIASGRATRVLVLLPDALINQWFVELLRRFNLAFAIFDEERCEAIEQAGDGRNPFEDEQWVIAGFGLFDESPKRREQLLATGWDLLIVDEAHHLEWSPEGASPRYAMVEQLAASSPGVVLLTATPEQLGRSGHFARLRLLDPARYHDLDAYLRESDGFVALSRIADKLAESATLDDAERTLLAEQLQDDEDAQALLEVYPQADSGDALLNTLIDRHGTGRVMFRNRRASVGGFPKRLPELRVLAADALDETERQALLAEFHADIQQPPASLEYDYTNDPRIDDLLTLLEAHPQEKFLLICRTRAKVLAIEETLRTRSGVGVARFHEDLSLLQRDRNAAWFAQADGARLLLCSEIGSEGRNFQFAHHLVLWDLPLDPDLLEQRIGRLDRIGQSRDIAIHVPVIADSAQHMLARWHHEAVNGLQESPADGRELLRRFGGTLASLAEAHARDGGGRDQELDVLIDETRAAHRELAAMMQDGRDRLLELAAQRAPQADALEQALSEADGDAVRDTFIQRLLEHFGVHIDELDVDSVLLDPEYLATDAFPGLGDGPQSATFSRRAALSREDLTLLRPDHPMVAGAIDLLLSSESGNAAFLVDGKLPPRSVLLQAVFVLECIADRHLDAERFLPPTPLIATVDTRLQARNGFEPSDEALQRAAERKSDLGRYRKFIAQLVPPMLERAEQVARAEADTLAQNAAADARTTLGEELQRLRALKRVNPGVRDEEIAQLATELAALEQALPQARLRLDAVRLVASPDFLALR
ncbi:RNA polymerase-associated protein RapA [Oleiagrimonas soli]|uniref:RNA polymerase-associated protein RapA n=1 Tax=Oleiagrimonas soli TaxID=1543381 RepID=A0A099CXH0_9GAMM|nr:RNA polymerase-associated protein RapA [Oleiagrimonas soli]KGI78361.1 helicase SNF2 [Oleiagrimonas soli]MBB6183911.1 ATP-dependent helicase HepA [Oleiagrimonas soli]